VRHLVSLQWPRVLTALALLMCIAAGGTVAYWRLYGSRRRVQEALSGDVESAKERAHESIERAVEPRTCLPVADAGPYSIQVFTSPSGMPQTCKCDSRGCCTCY
jgi:hypothetical protein